MTAKENFRLRLMRNQMQYERRYHKKMAPILADQLQEALTNLEAKAASIGKDYNEKLFDDAAADALMQKILLPVLEALSDDQGSFALLFAGDEEHEFKMNQALRNKITSSTKRMAANFNDDTLHKLNDTLTAGTAAGEGLEDLKARVREIYGDAMDSRVTRVARTETLKASNYATNEAYRQTGYVTAKEWYANPGACEICEAMDGKQVGLDDEFIKQGGSVDLGDDKEPYVVSYEDVEAPPIHPNCRCTIVPVR